MVGVECALVGGVGARQRRRVPAAAQHARRIVLSPISDWRAVSGAKLKPTDAQFGLNGNEAAAAYDRGVRGYFKLARQDAAPGQWTRTRSC